MSAPEQFAIIRFIISCLMIIGGVICVVFGYKLFSSGSGLYKSGIDRFAIKRKEFNVSVSGMSAGATLMATSALWGYFAYSSVPRLEVSIDGTKIVKPLDVSGGPTELVRAIEKAPTETVRQTGEEEPKPEGAQVTPAAHQTSMEPRAPVDPRASLRLPDGLATIDESGKVRGTIVAVHWSLARKKWEVRIQDSNGKVFDAPIDSVQVEENEVTVVRRGEEISRTEIQARVPKDQLVPATSSEAPPKSPPLPLSLPK